MSPLNGPDERTPLNPPLRKSILSGELTGWTLDIPPHLHNFTFAFIPLYCSLIPVARILTRPNGYFSILLDKVWGPRGTGTIVKLVVAGVFHTFLTTAVGSAWGQSCHPRGYQNQYPRLAKNDLRGLAHRVTAAHQSLIEVFPAFGVTAALILATRDITKTAGPSTLIDGLILHFLLKNVVFYISYLANHDFNRSASHVFAISTILSVLFELSGALQTS